MEKEIGSWGWYDLKYELAELIIPKLEVYLTEYSKGGMSIPTCLLDAPQDEFSDSEIDKLVTLWKSELNHMIGAFKQILNYKTAEDEKIDYDEAYIQDGLNKFAKYFQDLLD